MSKYYDLSKLNRMKDVHYNICFTRRGVGMTYAYKRFRNEIRMRKIEVVIKHDT